MTRRNLELVLLCIAVPLVVLLFAMMAANQGLSLGVNTLGVPLGIFAAFVAAHLAVRKFAPGADPALLPIAFALSGIGIAFVTRLAPDLAVRQVVWLFAGIACMIAVLAFLRNIDKVAGYKYTLMIAGLAFLLSPLIPGLGQEIYGSRIWLSLGPFSFQPGELAKILIVLFLAGYLAHNREMLSVFTWRVGPFRLPDFSTLLPLLLMWLIALLIVVFEKDLGSALVFFFIFLAMLYVASGKKFYLIVGLGLAAVAGIALFLLFTHVQTRVNTWLDPFADAQGGGYQLVQSLYSIADGGLFGVGIGRGMADIIPVVESDFIFVAIAEEAGLLGAAGVLLLYLSFAIRGFATAARAKSDVSSFIAVGLTAMIVLQAFIIVGGVTKLIPLTGITLPFISQGGSSLLASFIAVGFLLRCGDEGTGVGQEMTVTGEIGGNASHSFSGRTNGNAGGTHLAGAHAPNAVKVPAEVGVLGRVALGTRLTNAMIIFSVLFAILVANLTYLMVVRADYYQNLPGNSHTIAKQADVERGTISTSDGVILAQSVKTDDGTYERVYPVGDLASHVVGYYSTRYGTSGIEAFANETLQGTQSFASWADAIDYLSGVTTPGNDVVLTIDSRIQQAAQDALEGRVGACVVLDPETSAVLALASSPTYNISDIETLLQSASESNGSELFNRATQGLYAPGSTFKIVTLSTALSERVANEDTEYDSPGIMEIGNADVSNFGDKDYGTITLARATELSSNTVYGQLGVEIGAKDLVKGAEKFGFNQSLEFELPLAVSLMPDPKEMTEWETAWAAAGMPVGEHESPAGPQATVLEMALVGCAIANGGSIMMPHLIEGSYNANGVLSSSWQPTLFAQAIKSDVADRVKAILEGVVSNGTGGAAAVSGVTVAGKTGTAEKADGDDSWFVGLAPVENPRVVVAIVIEDGYEGEGTTRAQNVLKTALQVQGVL